MWGAVRVVLLGLFLAWQAIEDYKTHSVRMDGIQIFGLLGVGIRLISEGIALDILTSIVASCVPGLVLLFLSKLFTENIGDGDGYIFLVSGIYLDGLKNGVLFYLSFLLAGLLGLALYMFPKGSVKKKVYPFVPFIFSAFLCVELWEVIV